VDADPESYFTRDAFHTEVQALREERAEDRSAMEILDKLEAWVLESGIGDL
jgi:hypothetical protein